MLTNILLFNERTKQLPILFTLQRDRNGFVLRTMVTPGNIHDSAIVAPLVNRVREKVGTPQAVAADAAYKTPAITNDLLENQMTPALPYTRPRTKEGYFRKYDYALCPKGETHEYSTTTKEGYRQYKSNPSICKTFPFLSPCT